MGRIRVLHICNWLPNRLGPSETPFVLRHIAALAPHVDQEVWHIAVEPGDGWRAVFHGPHADRTFLFRLPIRRWRVIEWMSHLLVRFAWTTRKRDREWDIVNLHIAYPLGVRTRGLLRMLHLPLVITEHWSAYHYSFGSNSSGLDRIRAIFGHGLPLITVSRSLLDDIEQFSGHEQKDTLVVDNVVEQEHFRHDPGTSPVQGRLVAVGGWRFPKRPDVLIELAHRLAGSGRTFQLRLVGDGPMLRDMEDKVRSLGLAAQVKFLGRLSPRELAGEMRAAHMFLHCSDHETYSVVCAEALCTGTPVVASAVGGIPEYMDERSGALVSDNLPESWHEAVERNWERTMVLDRASIARRHRERTSAEQVGARYARFLTEHVRHVRTNGQGTENTAAHAS